ncbi:cell surface protein [Sporolactobacillus shoreicorticis]|uniref:Cell surface protein n=1 Tax=Sporolactobacillus shoreicorticis TaxID=1923877 RepID=A0ABW5S5V7_9BACL|nr:cell surface protein [Sporolactobacillus shoreicorticis]MCO7125816.1 cell surface protein [Sporolactobacillus shoreicorticis]
MKFKRFIISALVLVLSVTTLSVPAHAATTKPPLDSSTVSNVTDQGISSELIQKANPFITIVDGKFNLNKNASSVLTQNEISEVTKLISENNKLIPTKNTIQKENTFIQTVSESTSNSQGKFTALAKKSSFYINIVYTWWGAQLQFSHKAVNDLYDFSSISGTVGVGTTLKKFLKKKGLTLASKWLGPISLYGTLVFWAMHRVDKGKGVNLNCVLYVPATITAR